MREVRALGYEVATVSYDSVETLADFATRRAIGFTLLSDPGTSIIRAFDVLDARYAGLAIAYPIIFVIDAAGVIRHRFSGKNYTRRPDIDPVLKTLRASAEGSGTGPKKWR